MLFNSIDFAVFLPIVFLLYWFITYKNLKLQNLLIVIASYVFYGWWDYRFLSLIFFSSIVDYFVGIGLLHKQSKKTRKLLLLTSLLVNLGFLGFFKYYNFFAENFAEAFTLFGYPIKTGSLHIILPVGISFYTFQTLSYSIDVYRRKLQPTRDFFAFLAYVSFFPQLVAGPIERATNLLPQFYKKRKFDYSSAVDGLRQILWGLFKKVVIADNCAEYANYIFNNSQSFDGPMLLLGAVFFAFQIYGDFSGYSDIAIGTSRLFGFNLMQNFAFPYFSRDVAEFWRRWHISLSTWFRDYLYIPLGGSRGGYLMKIRNTLIIFVVSGFWHGANWTFIVWGFLNALYIMPSIVFGTNRKNLDIVAKGKIFPNLREFVAMSLTFSLTLLAWVFFRATSISHAIDYLASMVTGFFKRQAIIDTLVMLYYKVGIELILLMLFFTVIEWFGRSGRYAIENTGLKWKRQLRLLFYYLIVILIFVYGGQQQEFIYFQF